MCRRTFEWNGEQVSQLNTQRLIIISENGKNSMRPKKRQYAYIALH